MNEAAAAGVPGRQPASGKMLQHSQLAAERGCSGVPLR
jgi:hypothetical protein